MDKGQVSDCVPNSRGSLGMEEDSHGLKVGSLRIWRSRDRAADVPYPRVEFLWPRVEEIWQHNVRVYPRVEGGERVDEIYL